MDTATPTECEQTWFVFAVINGDDIARVLLVEAPNADAIRTLEGITKEDGKANPGCELLAIHKGNVTPRSSRRLTEISYVDFIIDIVEPSRLVCNQRVATAFQKSFSEEDRKYALMKMEAIEAFPEPEETPAAPMLERPKAPPLPAREQAPMTPSNIHNVAAMLADLGFKKPQVKEVLASMGTKIDSMSLEDAVREALKSLVKA